MVGVCVCVFIFKYINMYAYVSGQTIWYWITEYNMVVTSSIVKLSSLLVIVSEP